MNFIFSCFINFFENDESGRLGGLLSIGVNGGFFLTGIAAILDVLSNLDEQFDFGSS